MKFFSPTLLAATPSLRASSGLRGLEAQNAHAFQRCIYIHGTPEENKIGRPASYGCIRMKSKDVAELYDQLPLGAVVQIIPDRLPKMEKDEAASGNERRCRRCRCKHNAAAATADNCYEGCKGNAAGATADSCHDGCKGNAAGATADNTATKAANVTPQPPPQISADMLATPPSSSLSLEQMRTAGALAGARQKAKLAANKRL